MDWTQVAAALFDIATGLGVIAAIFTAIFWALLWVGVLSTSYADPPSGWLGVFMVGPLVVLVILIAWQIGRNF